MEAERPLLSIPTLTLSAVANIRLHKFLEAERALVQADELCGSLSDPICGEAILARGLLAKEQTQFKRARQFYDLSLSFARLHNNRFLESISLLNLGSMALTEGHFDEAIDWSEDAYQAAHTLNARVVELVALGNIGWAHYRLGDHERALELFTETERLAAQVGDVSDQENELTNIGYVRMDSRRPDLAAGSFRQALDLAEGIKAKEDIYNALRVLARLELQTGNIEKASLYAERALTLARESGNRADELSPLLSQGQVAARLGDIEGARRAFLTVEQDKNCPIFLKWEAEHSLAQLYEDQKQQDAADRAYQAALATFEGARADVRHEDSQLSFLTNASRIYDDYVHFLIARGKPDEALRWADYSRARTLAEGLGLLANAPSSGPPPLRPQQIAKQSGRTILFYWLGEKQSYLWAITPQTISVSSLPPAQQIEAAARRYRTTLGGPDDVLQSRDADGQALYRMLVAPAQALLKKDARVFIIPDGSLNNLNFETLLVPNVTASPSTLHYWIEDATIANASSLRVLSVLQPNRPKPNPSLLLIGNSIAPNDKYPELPQAAAQMAGVAKHFPASQQQVLTREQATPAAYLASHPERFDYIHFVAHGTASRLSPLDSAIVLSKTKLLQSDAANESFKLYARDIVRHPLRADLVTISACYGAGERAYSGEGLVGLSWAFLRAGTHNVVAALWEATDTSTEQLMNRFYEELDKGNRPDAALRAAKLSLLRDTGFRNPFYWAPFQLYTGR